MEIIPGIYQIKIPIRMPGFQLVYVNLYLIRGDDGYLLVDTGWNATEAFDALVIQLKEIGVDFTDIIRIIITHLHPDHYGLAGRLKELSGATITLHQREKDLIDSRYIHMDSLLNEIAEWLKLHGVPKEELPRLQKASLAASKSVLPAQPDHALHGGEKIDLGSFCFEVLWTPGHSPGHLCLYEQNKKILISGDHILPATFTNVSLHPQSGENPLHDYFESLKCIDQLEVDITLPAHEHVFTDLKQRLGELFHHHEDRREAILKILRERTSNAYEISSGIPWIVNGSTLSFDKLIPLDKRLAVMSALAHLKLLHKEKRIESTSMNGCMAFNTPKVR